MVKENERHRDGSGSFVRNRTEDQVPPFLYVSLLGGVGSGLICLPEGRLNIYLLLFSNSIIYSNSETQTIRRKNTVFH